MTFPPESKPFAAACLTAITCCAALFLAALHAAAVPPATRPAETHPVDADGFGPEVKGLRAKVSLERDRFTIGEPIATRYAVRNVSAVDQTLWHSGFWPNHQILVTAADGNEVKPTDRGEEGRRAFHPGGERDKNFPVTIGPGREDDTEGRFDLTRYYDLTRPGRYAVQIVYEEKQGGWQGRLPSNAAEFEVVAKP